MPPLEVNPLALGLAVFLLTAVVGAAAYTLGWRERGLADDADAERQERRRWDDA